MIYKLKHHIKTFFLLLTLAAFVTFALMFQKHSVEIIAWIKELGWMAPVLFVIMYSLATIMLLPTMVLTLAGGALFGPIMGTIINLIGATCGAALAFLITRHLIYDWFSTKRGEKLNKLIAGVDQKGWIFIALLRLFPIIPFNLVNYGLGVTGVSFRLYLIITLIFLIPSEIIYTYCGYAGMGALSNPEHFHSNLALIICGLAVLFFSVITFIKSKVRLKKPLNSN
ncbi:MAG TPA: TVP38/TMEM64 family protein [Legionella sp.]|nr:TVP38/TMEM64 family protein [Legionella sp.]